MSSSPPNEVGVLPDPWAEIPKPTVKRQCLICSRVARKYGWDEGQELVGPTGTAHHQKDENNSTRTVCGLAADGPDWWWPL